MHRMTERIQEKKNAEIILCSDYVCEISRSLFFRKAPGSWRKITACEDFAAAKDCRVAGN